MREGAIGCFVHYVIQTGIFERLYWQDRGGDYDMESSPGQVFQRTS
jgi:hypothetical protein